MAASLHAILTHHAQARMQQRGNPPGAVEHVLRYGRERHDRHGAAVAENLAQAQALWRLRETIPEAACAEGADLPS